MPKEHTSSMPVRGAKFCARRGAGVVSMPLVLAGAVVAVAGGPASLGLVWPGIAAGGAVGVTTKDAKAGAATLQAVTYSVVGLGVAIAGAGVAAGVYAAHGRDGFKDDKDKTPDMAPRGNKL